MRNNQKINALVFLLYRVDMKHKQIESDIKTSHKSISNIIGLCVVIIIYFYCYYDIQPRVCIFKSSTLMLLKRFLKFSFFLFQLWTTRLIAIIRTLSHIIANSLANCYISTVMISPFINSLIST